MSDSLPDYLDSLNAEQKAAVIHEGSPLLILAGAGSGKTRVITTKIAYLISEKNIEPWSILAVTFTKKAANEMRERAVAIDSRAADAQIRTFHSFGSWFLRKFAEQAGLDSSFTVYDEDDMASIIKDIVPGMKPREYTTLVKQISLAKDYCLTPDDDLSKIESEFDLNLIYKKYQESLRATKNVDFGDLIMLPVQILEANKEVADYIHNRFKVIMVDEYQDSNIAQYRLLQELSGVKEGNDSYVCVVGDDDQSIYRFRGAEVENILTFQEKFPGTQIIKLETNYRSTGSILKTADLVVNKNAGRLGKTLVSAREEGDVPVLTFLPDQTFETNFVYELIKQSVAQGARYSDWAVFYRMNSQAREFETKFLHNNIPYEIYGSLKFLEREEIKDALAYISFFANHRDVVSFKRIVNKPARGIGDKTLKTILQNGMQTGENGELLYADFIDVLRSSLMSLSKKACEGAEKFIRIFEKLENSFSGEKLLADFISDVIHFSELDEYHKGSEDGEDDSRVENLRNLMKMEKPYKCTSEDLAAFLDSITLERTVGEKTDSSDGNAVVLSTLHNTKGLEFNRVVITGLEEGVFPYGNKTGPEIEEERRLFYVGVTRARDNLYITSTQKRFLYGHWEFVRPSRFIQEAAASFKIQGTVPFGFGRSNAQKVQTYSSFGRDASAFASNSENTELKELAAKWKKGLKVYNDDYGYGVITFQSTDSGELVVEVTFETGTRKKFMPQYQKGKLDIIKDGY